MHWKLLILLSLSLTYCGRQDEASSEKGMVNEQPMDEMGSKDTIYSYPIDFIKPQDFKLPQGERSIEEIMEAMVQKHIPYIEEAGEKGVQILCLQEIFNTPYFCPGQDHKWYASAEPTN